MIIERYLPCVHAYADVTQLYLGQDAPPRKKNPVLQPWKTIKAIRAWMIMDKMKIKTEFLIIGTKQLLNTVNIKTLSVGDSAVAPAAMARNLGVLFDENMTLLPHINTCKTAFYYTHNIRRIRKYLSVETTRTLVHAVVIGRLDYCNSLLYGLPMKSISKLQRVQNAAARLITNTPDTTTLLQSYGLYTGYQ